MDLAPLLDWYTDLADLENNDSTSALATFFKTKPDTFKKISIQKDFLVVLVTMRQFEFDWTHTPVFGNKSQVPDARQTRPYFQGRL